VGNKTYKEGWKDEAKYVGHHRAGENLVNSTFDRRVDVAKNMTDSQIYIVNNIANCQGYVLEWIADGEVEVKIEGHGDVVAEIEVEVDVERQREEKGLEDVAFLEEDECATGHSATSFIAIELEVLLNSSPPNRLHSLSRCRWRVQRSTWTMLTRCTLYAALKVK
jgi:hypothetical protein